MLESAHFVLESARRMPSEPARVRVHPACKGHHCMHAVSLYNLTSELSPISNSSKAGLSRYPIQSCKCRGYALLISHVREALVRRPSSQPALAPRVTRNTTRHSTSTSSRPLLMFQGGMVGQTIDTSRAPAAAADSGCHALVSSRQSVARFASEVKHSYIWQANFVTESARYFCARVGAKHAKGASTCTCASRMRPDTTACTPSAYTT